MTGMEYPINMQHVLLIINERDFGTVFKKNSVNFGE